MINVGGIEATLSARFDDDGFDKFERALRDASRRADRGVAAHAKLDVDQAGFRTYQRQLDRAERDARAASGKMSRAFAGVGRGVALLGASGGVATLGLLAKSAISASSDIAESLSKNRVLFGKYAKDIDRFSRDAATSIGMSRQSVLEYTGTFGNLFTALGISQRESAKFSTGLTKLAADMASFNNSSPEEALEAIRSGLVGETEPLRRFGVNINDATLQAEALRKGLIKSTKEALDPQTKALAAQSLIVKQTSKAHGDFERTSGGLANQQRIANAQIKDQTATLGKSLLPAQLAVTKALVKFIGEMKAGEGAGGRFVDTLKGIGSTAAGIGGFIKDHVKLIEAAAVAWAAYRVKALAAAAAGKIAASSAVAGGAAGAAGAGGRLAGAARAVGPYAAIAGGFFVRETLDQRANARGGFDLPSTGGFLGRGQRRVLDGGRQFTEKLGRGDVIGALFSSGRDPEADLRKFGDSAEKEFTRARRAAAGVKLERLAARARELADRFPRAAGALEKFARTAEGAARIARTVGEALRRNLRLTARDILDPGAVDQFLSNLGRMRNGGIRSIADLRSNMAFNAKQIEKGFADGSKGAADAMTRNFTSGIRALKRAMKDGTVSTKDGMGEIRRITAQQMTFARDNMDRLSGQGKDRLAANFRSAVQAIRARMKEGTVSTEAGMREIRQLMRAELALYGITGKQASRYLDGKDTLTGKPMSAPGKAGGGWIGNPGEVGHDMVPAMLGRGEAVLNRHQQAVIEGYLGDGFLDSLFARVQRPHYLAKGGRVARFAEGGFARWSGGSTTAFARALAARFGLRLGSGYRTPAHNAAVGGSATSDHMKGSAANPGAWDVPVWAGDPRGDRLAAAARAAGVPQVLWKVADHYDHVHLGFGGAGGGSRIGTGALSAPTLKRVLARAGIGALTGISQGALDRTRGAAQAFLDRAIGSAGGSGSGGGGGGARSAGGRYGKAALMALWRAAGGTGSAANLAAAVALGESGGNPNASNRNTDGSIDRGLWQINSIHGAKSTFDPAGNARSAVSISSNGRNWNPWVVFQRGMHRQYLARGGRPKGGRGRVDFGGAATAHGMSPAAQNVGPTKQSALARLRPLNLMQHDRKGAYTAALSRVDKLDTAFNLAERRYNREVKDFELVNDDGTLNVIQIDRQAGLLDDLAEIRRKIEAAYEEARKIAQRISETYATIVGRLRQSLRLAGGRNRKGIEGQISAYESLIGQWGGRATEAADNRDISHENLLDTLAEAASVRGTKARIPGGVDDAFSAGSGGDSEIDRGGFDRAGDPVQLAPSAEQIATGVAEELARINSARASLFAGFGSNANRAGAGAFTTDLQRAAGARFYGAVPGEGDVFGSMGGQERPNVTITQHYAAPPPDPHTYSQSLAFEIRSAV